MHQSFHLRGHRPDRKSARHAALPGSAAVTLVSLCMVLAAPTALADDWINAGTGDWVTPGNWQDGTVPTSVDDANIGTGVAVLEGAATAAGVHLGGTGFGELIIQNGGALSAQATFIGYLGDGSATVDGAGSSWANTLDLRVGHVGAGTLNIQNGGLVSNDDGILGAFASSGSVTVDGAGSTWANGGLLAVGSSGFGALTITAGAEVRNTDGYIGSAITESGSDSGEGTVVVEGSGSTWLNQGEDGFGGELNVGYGYGGDASLVIGDGGAVYSASGAVGRSGATGTVTVTGAGSEWGIAPFLFGAAGELHIGQSGSFGTSGRGTLLVEDGGKVADGSAVVGEAASGIGSVTVSGANSLWSNTEELIVGASGQGMLTIADGGTVRVDFEGDVGGGTVSVGVESGSAGTLNIGAAAGAAAVTPGALNAASVAFGAGDGEIVFNHTDDDYVFSPDISGDGSVRIESGITTLTGTNTYTGATHISGGTLAIDDAGALGTGDIAFGGGELLGAETLTLSNAQLIWNAGETGIIAAAPGKTLTLAPTALYLRNANSSIQFGAPGQDGTVVLDAPGSIGSSPGVDIALAAGTLRIGGGLAANFFDSSNIDVVDIAAGATLDINGHSVGITNLAGGGTITDGLAGTVQLTAIASDATTFSGTIEDGAGPVSFAKMGAATLTLDGQNTYTGQTTVVGGALEVKGGLALPDPSTVSFWDVAGGSLLVTQSETVGALSGGGTNGGDVLIADAQVLTTGANNGFDTYSGIISGAGGLEKIGTGMQTLRGANTYAGDTVVLGGTLMFSGDTAGLGGDISNDAAVVFDQWTDSSFAGVISGSGSLTKTGAGTTILTGESSYTGATDIVGGTLLLQGALGDTAVSVAAGATLGGSGTIDGAVTIADGGILAPGASAGTLAVGSLILNDGSMLDYEVGQAGVIGGGTNDLIEVAGNLTLDGVLNVTDTGDFGPGVYRLMSYGGVLADNGLDLGALPSGLTTADLTIQTSIAHQVSLINAAGAVLDFWDGAGTANDGLVSGGAGVWSAANGNWADATGVLNGAWNTDFAVFQRMPGTVTANDAAGAIAVNGMQFAVDGYRIEGAAVRLNLAETVIRVGDGTATGAGYTATIASDLIGTGALAKSDFGTLVLTGTNTYEGGTVLRGGTLEVANEANLGAASGALTFDGGVLRVAGTGFADTTRPIVWADNGGGFDIAEAGHTFTVAQDLNGSGSFVKRGAGTLVLTGSNDYGGTAVEAGTLVGDTTSLSGDLSNDGVVIFDQGADGVFVGAIAGSGTMVKDGAGNLSLGGTNVLDWEINEGSIASAAERFGGNVAIGASGTFTLDQAGDAVYDGILSGSGFFTKSGAGALRLSGDSSSFAGNTQVRGGTLVVGVDGAGALGGTLEILDGGQLRGSGTVGTTVVDEGGTVSPGNSPGTLTVAGDLTLAAGSVYEVEVDPEGTGSDLIHATGQAFLNGSSLAQIGLSGAYEPSRTYTVVIADGGVEGTFAEISSAFAFLDATLSYDPTRVLLTLERNDLTFADMGSTRNQRAAAAGAESLGSGNALYDAVVSFGRDADATLRAAFDNLSGEIHADLRSALMQDSRFVRNALTDRIRSAFGDPTASSAMSTLTYGPNGPETPPADGRSRSAAPAERFAAWGQVYGAWGEIDGDSNAAALERSSAGFFLGADAPIGNTWRAGLAAGYGRASVDVDARGSTADDESATLAAYAGTQIGALGLRFGAAHTWHAIDTRRSIAFPGFSGIAEAGYHARTAQALGEAGYRVDMEAVRLEPFANVAYIRLDTDKSTEIGSAAASTSSDVSADTFNGTLGLRAATSFDVGSTRVRPHGTLGWRHTFGDIVPLSTHAFTDGAPFTVAGVPVAEDAALIEAGLDLDLSPTATLDLSYAGQVGDGTQDHAVSARLEARF